MHDSIDRVVTLDMCSGMDVLVPVNLAECRMAGIDIGCVVEHGVLTKDTPPAPSLVRTFAPRKLVRKR